MKRAWFYLFVGLYLLITAQSKAEVSFTSRARLSDEPSRVLYQIYVETFRDARSASGGQGSDGFGDFAGLQEKLEYLRWLGVTGLLIMPVFESDDDMGYIPRDFYLLREKYAGPGTASAREDALRSLIQAAHARDIKVYIDAPINHISIRSEWFQNSARKLPGWEDAFLWSDRPKDGWKIPWEPTSGPSDVWFKNDQRGAYYYALFGWGMPEFNHRSPAVTSIFDAFFQHYAELGADGFRIDAAKHLLEGETNVGFVADNIPLLQRYLRNIRSRFPQTSFLIEVWSGYGEIEAFPLDSGDVKFDFPYMEALRDSLKYNHPYGVRNTLEHMMLKQREFRPGNRVVFAGNHDLERIRTLAQNDAPKAELGLALTLSLPYIPLIYYGDEIYMAGNYIRYPKTPEKNENNVCMPMLWNSNPNAGFSSPDFRLPNTWNKKIAPDYREINVEAQLRNPHGMLRSVQRLLAIRKTMRITNDTRFYVDRASDSDPVLKTTLVFPDGTCTVGVYNFSSARQNARGVDFQSNVGPKCNTNTASTLVQKRVYNAQEKSLDLDPYGYWIGWGRIEQRRFH